MSLAYRNFEAQHVTLVASADTVITFTHPVHAVRVRNWDTTNRILVKQVSAIVSDSDPTAGRVGKASTADIPTISVFPIHTQIIHIRSAGASEVTVEGYC